MFALVCGSDGYTREQTSASPSSSSEGLSSPVSLSEPVALWTIWDRLKLDQESSVILRRAGIESNAEEVASLNLATALSVRHLVKKLLTNGLHSGSIN